MMTLTGLGLSESEYKLSVEQNRQKTIQDAKEFVANSKYK